MNAIITKYVGPTNTKPARIVATVKSPSKKVSYSMSYDHELTPFNNHVAAAKALVQKHFTIKANWDLLGADHDKGYAFIVIW